MKIIILHGDDSVKSYERLTKFMDTAKSRGWEILYDYFPDTPSLFGNDRLIIFRDYRLLNKQIISNLHKFEGTLVVYHPSNLPALFLKQIPSGYKVEKFDVPRLIFTFLDSLSPGSVSKSINLLKTILKNQPLELVFYFLSKHFRDLYWTLKDADSTGFPRWKIDKLKKQAEKFGYVKLSKIISNLARLDIDAKTGRAILDVELDQLLYKSLK